MSELEAKEPTRLPLGSVCKHDTLARTCEVCELEAEVAELTRRLEVAEHAVRELVFQSMHLRKEMTRRSELIETHTTHLARVILPATDQCHPDYTTAKGGKV